MKEEVDLGSLLGDYTQGVSDLLYLASYQAIVRVPSVDDQGAFVLYASNDGMDVQSEEDSASWITLLCPLSAADEVLAKTEVRLALSI